MNTELESLKAGFVKIQNYSTILVITLNRYPYSQKSQISPITQLSSHYRSLEMFNTDNRKFFPQYSRFTNKYFVNEGKVAKLAKTFSWQKCGHNIIIIMYLYISPPNVYELLCYLHDCGQFLHRYPAGVRGHHGQLCRYTCTRFCSYPDLACIEGGMEKL